MIQGTGSGAGKSAVVAGLCRIFRDMGIKVAPFKSQNMALNSYITLDGGEIGRATAFQAEAAGIEPETDMNPVLLKATGESGCQVILNGRVYDTMKAHEYYAIKKMVWQEITAAYDRLSEKYDLIIIEGAGSPAEINLRNEEVVNMKVARYADAAVILVGDIDRGGVFAQFYGTVELLKDPIDGFSDSDKTDSDYIKAFIINKFRGDMEILRPGLRMIEDKTNIPVIGTLYWQGNIGLDEEDGLSIEEFKKADPSECFEPLKVVVLRLKYIANFTDFAPFMYEKDIEFKYSMREEDIINADLIIIPGSKNTVADLMLLRQSGMEQCIKKTVAKGTPLIGICGGYQMLGQKILDPENVESNFQEIEGMGLLDTITTMDSKKTTCRVTAKVTGPMWFKAVPGGCGCRWNQLKGYEIHMGQTTGDLGLFEIERSSGSLADGSAKGNVWGTYLHGIFDNDGLRTDMLNSLRKQKGLVERSTVNYKAIRESSIDHWAKILGESVDICFMLRQVGMESCMNRFQEELA